MNLLFALLLFAQVSSDTSDFTEEALSAEEAQATYQIGTGGDEDARFGAPRWVYIDGRGLSAAARDRLRDALTCQGDGTSRLTRLGCALGQSVVGEWTKAAAADEWVGYVVPNRQLAKRLKWCIGNGTCNQSGRVAIVGKTWTEVQAHPRCADFYGLRCLSGDPPVKMFKVSTEIGAAP